MLIVALVMAVIGLAALVAAVVTSNEVFAWVCIGASAIGVVLLIVDAVRERQRRDAGPADDSETTGAGEYDAEYPDEQAGGEEPAADETAADETAADEMAADETAVDKTAVDKTTPDETTPDETAPEGKAPEERSDSETSR
jgi:hypothetical protein